MNRVFQYGSVVAIPFHNCSWRSYEEWDSTGVKKPWFGYPLIVFGVIVEVLYVPIIYIILTTKLIKLPCYKIIVVLAVVDMNATVCSCLLTGYLFIVGSVFCTYPNVTYMAGVYTMTTWGMACVATIALFVNRIISIGFRKYAEGIEKQLAYISIILTFIYGCYMFYFVPSIIFNSDIMAYIPETLSEKVMSEEAAAMYKNVPHEVNNWSFAGIMIILFSIYLALVNKLARGQKSKASRSIFIQCCIICFFNTAVAVINCTLAFMTPPPWILVICQLCWAGNHSCPAFIYVTMNDTIRREFYRLVFRVKLNGKLEDATTSTAVKKLSTISIQQRLRRKSEIAAVS